MTVESPKMSEFFLVWLQWSLADSAQHLICYTLEKKSWKIPNLKVLRKIIVRFTEFFDRFLEPLFQKDRSDIFQNTVNGTQE